MYAAIGLPSGKMRSAGLRPFPGLNPPSAPFEDQWFFHIPSKGYLPTYQGLWWILRCTTMRGGIDRVENSLPLIVAACALSLTLSSGSVLWCALFSTPARFSKYVERVESALTDLITRQEDIEARWIREKANLAALQESIEGTLESVERKRRQISGAASRLNQNAEPALPQDRDALVQVLRAKVYGNTG